VPAFGSFIDLKITNRHFRSSDHRPTSSGNLARFTAIPTRFVPKRPASFHLHLLKPTWSANCIRKSSPLGRHFALNATRFLISIIAGTIFKQCSA
jgi:hypothetical protein